MRPIPIFVPRMSPRLSYILGWLFDERIGTGFRIITNEAEAAALPFCIAYGKDLPHTLSLPDAGLLWSDSIKPVAPNTGIWQGLPTIFSDADRGYTLPFDLFSALFFLISRYEEYSPYSPDKHGRYPATESLQYKNAWLDRPLADEWIHALRSSLQQAYSVTIPKTEWSFLPSYDIDIAWSYRHKGWKRAIGGALKDLTSGEFQGLRRRLAVGTGIMKDPYDAFEQMQIWHQRLGLHPLYFVLSSRHTTLFDKNISPHHPAMQALIRQLASEGTVGIHPSYYSDQATVLPDEKKLLESIMGQQIIHSRQHYIRLQLPDTCHDLLQAGITHDFSMGYGTHLGFRAATGYSFPWYNLSAEKATPLRLHPFCFMDTTARYEAQLSAPAAFQKLEQMAASLRTVHSHLITIFHNFSLGSDPGWQGWSTKYEDFLQRHAR